MSQDFGVFGVNLSRIKARQKAQSATSDLLSQDIGEVTDRSQIINPNEVVNPDNYGLGRRERLRYESDLAQAKLYAEQQEAAYQEWYDSPAQQAARQREAGLNPDLMGVEQSQASDVAQPDSSPMSNIPSNLDVASTALGSLGSIASVLSGVSGIMSTISSIGLQSAQKHLIDQQADGQFLNNIDSFRRQSYAALSDHLANAIRTGGDSFNIDDYYAQDFNDLYSSLSPSDDPRYRQSFDDLKSSSQKIFTDAYKELASTEDGRNTYLRRLASGYYSDDDDEMVGQLGIVVQAEEELFRISMDLQKSVADIKKRYMNNLDVDSAASAVNDENEYKSEYYGALDGEIIAQIHTAVKRASSVITSSKSDVYSYLRRQFKRAPLPQVKQRVGWQIVAGSSFGWEDHLLATCSNLFTPIINEVKSRTALNHSSAYSNFANSESNRIQAEAAKQNANTNVRRADLESFRLDIANEEKLLKLLPWF